MADKLRLSLFNREDTSSFTRLSEETDTDENEGHFVGDSEVVPRGQAEDRSQERRNDLNIQETIADSCKKEEPRMYKVGPFAPRCLQPMNNLPCFLAWSILLILAWSFSSLGPGIPHIEKQYGLSSKMTAVLGSCQDIGGLCLMLFVSYVGTKLNMAKGVAIGAFVYGFGGLVICIPHYMEKARKFAITENKENATNLDICPLTAITGGDGRNSSTTASIDDTHYTTYVILVIGELLRGFGTTPLFTLGTAYLDENGQYPASAIYIGISYAASSVGAAISSVCSGYIVDHIYVDFDKADKADIPKDSTDPNWIGAWWLNFQISAVICMFVAIPLYGYPKQLPGVGKNKKEGDPKEVVEDVSGKSVCDLTKDVLRGFIRAIRRLLFNAEFVVLSIATAVTTCAVIGIGMFSFKYFTQQYDISFEVTGYIMASKAVFGGMAFVTGGWIIRHFKLNALGIERLSFALSIVSAALGLGLLARCPNVKLSGVEVPYMGQNGTTGLVAECQGRCQCQGHPFNPVCGADDMVYYSPCHAGCTHKMVNGSQTIYTNCSCVDTLSSKPGLEHDQTARAGRCELGCYGVYLSTPFTFLMLFLTGMSISNESIATLRCVDQDLRPFALGIQWIIMRLLGNIPSPVFLGAVLDDVCKQWSDPIQGEGTRYCQLYDKEKLSYGFCFLWLAGNFLSGFLFLLSSYFNVRRNKNRIVLDDKNTEMADIDEET